MLSTYCGSFSQRAFKQHIATCGVCWNDAQQRIDLTFDPSNVPDPEYKPAPKAAGRDVSTLTPQGVGA